VDVAWIAPFTIQKYFPNNWLSHLQSEAPKLFSDTKILEVRFWDWKTTININDAESIWIDNHVPSEQQMQPFLEFPSLECVKLTRKYIFHLVNLTYLHRMKDQERQHVAGKFQQWLEKNKKAFPGGVPLVTVED
jgi:hypothetical protein